MTRHPISRAIAGDYNNNQKYPQIFLDNNGTEQDWWNFAKEKRNDNFVLHALSDATCCAGPNTDRKYLEMAKDLVQRFTFVLDIGCLDRGLEKVADILGFEVEHHTDVAHQHTPLEERIPFPGVLSYLKEKNKLDIELHEWAKSIALVDCDEV